MIADPTLELAFLAMVLQDGTVLDRVSGIIAPDDLADPNHQLVLQQALDLRAAGSEVNLITMRGALGLLHTNGSQDVMGALQAVAMGGVLPPVTDVVSQIKDLGLRRRMVETAQRLQTLANDPSVSVQAAMAEHGGSVDAIVSATSPRGRTFFSAYDAVDQWARDMAVDPRAVVVPTGFASIDHHITGLPRGEMTIVAGATSMGKTAFALQLAINIASAGGGVVYFSQEMGNPSFAARIASLAVRTHSQAPEHNIPYSMMRPGRLSPEQTDIATRTSLTATRRLPLTVDYQRNVTVPHISMRIRHARQYLREAHGVNLDAVIVDHLGLATAPPRKGATRYSEVTDLSNNFARIGKDEDVAMVCLSQLNREGSKSEERPMLHHLRESGALEQDASLVMLLYREAYRLERQRDAGHLDACGMADLMASQNKLEVNIAKQRNGAPSMVELRSELPYNLVTDKPDWRHAMAA